MLRQNEAVAVDDVTRHVKEAMAGGRIRDQDPDMLAHALIGATRHLARTLLYARRRAVDAGGRRRRRASASNGLRRPTRRANRAW